MTPQQFTISTEGEDLHKSRSPAMRNACDACICSVFRYLENQLTVFPGAGIAGKFFFVRNTVKKFRLGARGQNYGVATTLFLQGLARAGDRA
jgi:hypothetical protein